jgi:hypothetical protein
VLAMKPAPAGLGGVQVLGRFPEVFHDVDEVEDQVDPDAVGVGLGSDPVDLVVVAVDQHGIPRSRP